VEIRRVTVQGQPWGIKNKTISTNGCAYWYTLVIPAMQRSINRKIAV
jgi:hypothetical protein